MGCVSSVQDGDRVQRDTSDLWISFTLPESNTGTYSIQALGAHGMDPPILLDTDPEPGVSWSMAGTTFVTRNARISMPTIEALWTESGQQDGRQSADFAILHSDGTSFNTFTQGYFQCWWDQFSLGATPGQTIDRCVWGRNEPAAPGAGGMTGLSAPIRLWRPVAAVAGDRTTTQWAPETDPDIAFTHNLVGHWVGNANASGGAFVPLPTADTQQWIDLMIPLGRPAGGETKDHLFLHPTTSGPVGAHEMVSVSEWSEALGYDCPRVLFDIDVDHNNANLLQAQRDHGLLATQRCLDLRDACTPGAGLPQCRNVTATHITPNANWQIRNRVYLGAPGDMRIIAVKGYTENRGLASSDPGLSGAVPEWTQIIVDLRFGAGQIMRLDHLAHLAVPLDSIPMMVRESRFDVDLATGIVVALGDSTATSPFPNGPVIAAGNMIGFVYRVPPWFLRLNVNNPGMVGQTQFVQPTTYPVRGNAFDWGVFDRLGTPNAFVNQARYDEGAGARFVNPSMLGFLHARCPYHFFGATDRANLDALRGTYVSGRNPTVALPCHGSLEAGVAGSAGGSAAAGGVVRTLRDRDGALAGQWFRVDPTSPASRGAPRLAVASDGTESITLSFFEPAIVGGERFDALSTCPPLAMMSGMSIDPGAVDCMAMSLSPLAPENVLAGSAVSSACYQSAGMQMGGGSASVKHVRLALIGDRLQVFRGAGVCPPQAQWANATPLADEAPREEYMR